MSARCHLPPSGAIFSARSSHTARYMRCVMDGVCRCWLLRCVTHFIRIPGENKIYRIWPPRLGVAARRRETTEPNYPSRRATFRSPPRWCPPWCDMLFTFVLYLLYTSIWLNKGGKRKGLEGVFTYIQRRSRVAFAPFASLYAVSWMVWCVCAQHI